MLAKRIQKYLAHLEEVAAKYLVSGTQKVLQRYVLLLWGEYLQFQLAHFIVETICGWNPFESKISLNSCGVNCGL